MSEQLEVSRIFKFNRGHLFLGGERSLVLATATLVLIMIVILQDKIAAIMGLILWFSLIPIYKMMAKHDPVLSIVYRLYFRYQRFYPAYSMKLMRWKDAKSTSRPR